jgi:uncharacterized protein YbjT (DUF2867 family)
MNIAIIGGNGFIGRHIADACRANNDTPVVFARSATADVCVDLQKAEPAHVWRARFDTHRIEAVINCVGILQGEPDVKDAVHHRAPAAMARACHDAKMPFLHVGVLGFYDSPATPYFVSKRRGEEAIRIAYPGAIIVRPSLVFGEDGPATQIMLAHAKSPVCVLPRLTKAIAPIHVDDLAELCAYLVGTIRAQGRDIDAVGAREMSIATYISHLRHGLNASHTIEQLQVRLPNAVFRALARCAAALGGKTFCPEIIDLMEHAHVGQSGAIAHWLHRRPREVESFMQPPRGSGGVHMSRMDVPHNV